MNKNKIFEELSYTEMSDTYGGGFFERVGYWAGRAVGGFMKAQETEFDPGLGGPTARNY